MTSRLIAITELAPVEVHLCTSRVRLGQTSRLGLSGKRACVWHNALRNDDLAKIANMAAAGNVTELWPFGLFLNESADFLRHYKAGSVAILVEATEHALELKNRLRDWEIKSCSANLVTKPGENHAGVIATFMFAARAGLDAQIIVRADGGGEPLRIKDFPAPRRDNSPPILLIDYADDEPSNNSRRRHHSYMTAGWNLQSDVASRNTKSSPATRSIGRQYHETYPESRDIEPAEESSICRFQTGTTQMHKETIDTLHSATPDHIPPTQDHPPERSFNTTNTQDR